MHQPTTATSPLGGKTMGWGIGILLVLAVVAVALVRNSITTTSTATTGSTAPRDKETIAAIEAARLDAELGKIAKSQERPLYLELGKPATVELKTDEWSREFVIPQDPEKSVTCKVSEEPQEGFWFYFKLRDTNPFFNVPAAGATHEVPFAGIAVQHRLFRLLGKKQGQKATIIATSEP